MTRNRTKITHFAIAITLALGGCEKPVDRAPETPAPTASAPLAEVPASILRESPVPKTSEPAIPAEPFTATVSFAQGGANLDEAAQEVIAQVLASAQFAHGGAITLWGHSDSIGADEANLRASRRRAEAVAMALEEAGVPTDRITVIAMGEMRPVAPNARLDGTPDEAGRALNRRVEISVAAPAREHGTGTPEEPPAPPAASPVSSPSPAASLP